MAVLLTPPYLYFANDEGNPLDGGKVYTYAAGTTNPKVTYTDADETSEHTNPIILDAYGRAVVFGRGAYKIVVKDSADNTIRTVDDVITFTVNEQLNDALFDVFSGTGAQTSFTLSDDAGTDEKAVYVFVDDELLPPTDYTINGTTLTFGTAPPATASNNIKVIAPSLLFGAASSAAFEAAESATAAEMAAAIAKSAAGYTYAYSTTTTASDPGSGNIRFNNATLSLASEVYISETTAEAQGIAADIATWDDSTSTIRGKLRIFKQGNPSIFSLFNVTGSITDNGTWATLTVAYVTGAGALSNADSVTVQYIRNGDKGDTGATGPAAAGVTAATSGTAAYVTLAEATNNGTSATILKGEDSLSGDVIITLPNATGTLATLDGAQTLTNKTISFDNNTIGGFAGVADGRLTLTSGVPVTTSNVTGATNVYYTPYVGNKIALYVGSAWVLRTFTEITHALGTVTNARPYDFFAYDNAGAVAIEKLAWTNDTTRATGLARQDGVLVKSGDATRRYIGTIYTTSTTTTADAETGRYVWNYYNRVTRQMRAFDSTATWNYTTATTRQANANTNNQLNFVVGVSEDAVDATVVACAQNSSAGVDVQASIGYDSTSVNSTSGTGQVMTCSVANAKILMSQQWRDIPSAGRHFLAWLEWSTATGTTTWRGGNTGILGSIRA